MIRRPPRSTQSRSSAASDVYKRQRLNGRLGQGAGEELTRWDPSAIRGALDEAGYVQAGQDGFDPGFGSNAEHLAQLGVGGNAFPVGVIVLEFGKILSVFWVEVSHGKIDTERTYCAL